MDAKELRKKLEEGLKTDVSGKTTPIQRLTPFLVALCEYLAMTEALATEHYKAQDDQVLDGIAAGFDMRKTVDALFPSKVSSDAATQVATAQTNSESDGAPKPAA